MKHFCLQCDDGTELVHERRDLSIHADEYVDNVAQVSGWHCPVCGECEFDAGEGARYTQALAALRAKANEQRAAAIRATCKNLGLRQAEAGRLLGGGA
ncbi:HTH-type transcriptional regulator / antitoxin MqsA [Giesbergeria anulus]|uniref:HTH-type transcriptional regulator / antitoxin MqsA n=1 Tax=Giesbergeria anulus TaxID=180197 RepID=A0A1H9Q8V6_9BURK|nr:HTH-type transcriptional regulator / antitoxin MqsA [Giesbergeria anulus]